MTVASWSHVAICTECPWERYAWGPHPTGQGITGAELHRVDEDLEDHVYGHVEKHHHRVRVVRHTVADHGGPE